MEHNMGKFIKLIECRPAIYNTSLKDHNNKQLIESLWMSIATEMNLPVFDCKQRWKGLRNSYARALREQRAAENDPRSRKRRVWYLEDLMSFMKDHMSQHNRANKALYETTLATKSDSNTEDDTIWVKNEVITPEDEPHFIIKNENQLEMDLHDSTSQQCTQFNTVTNRTTTTTATAAAAQTNIENDTHLMFMKSLLPDLRKLSERRQRVFKQNMLTSLNLLLEEQENESLNQRNYQY